MEIIQRPGSISTFAHDRDTNSALVKVERNLLRSFLFRQGTIAVVSFPSRHTGINSVDKVIDFVDSRQNVSCFIFYFFFSFHSSIFIDWSVFFSLDVR